MEITINAQMVKELRAKTGAGIIDAKKALQATDGDMEKAAEELRKSGALKAAKKADRDVKEGFIGSYVHATGKLAAMVGLQCETDFVARNEEFQSLAYDLAMHVVAADPTYIRVEDVPADVVAKEKEILHAQLTEEGKDEEMIEKIIPGKLEKYYETVVLLKQPYLKNDEITVEGRLNEAVALLGENIQIGSFHRMSL